MSKLKQKQKPVVGNIDWTSANTIRFLSADGVQRANSGHPGMPMGAAMMAYVLWSRHLKHAPTKPSWENRDRFILSPGHGSMLLYSLLHLTGYNLPMDELKHFRQWGSKTPGHPEFRTTVGVETTTGPLGQGFANGVGMAIAERFLAAKFNRPTYPVIDHYTFGICSDGDLMEGISHEAASLAGHLGLGKLIFLYDDNEISIDGSTDLTFTEDVGKRFEAYHWHIAYIDDGNDVEALDAAIVEAKGIMDKPSLIVVATEIGYGSVTKQGTPSVHGAPLGDEDLALSKRAVGCSENTFSVPDEVYRHMRDRAIEQGDVLEKTWQDLFNRYRTAYPDLAARYEAWMAGELPADWADDVPVFDKDSKMATRASGGKVLNTLAPKIEFLIGGSADLTPSNKTDVKGRADFQKERPDGEYFRFGVREHAMASICNGMALHGGLIPYCGTFLVFSDYMRPAVRLSALMKLQVIYVYTHDSIGVGEDGPTHQPVEQIAALRAIPGLTVIRPADANETAEAWKAALMNNDGPTALALTRQGVPTFDRDTMASAEDLHKGAYILLDTDGPPDILLIGTGSEVHHLVTAAEILGEQGIQARIVSMPSWELFEKQPQNYMDKVLPPEVKERVAIEAGITMGWEKYVGSAGIVIGLDRFGLSAPFSKVMEEFGFTPANVVVKAKELLG